MSMRFGTSSLHLVASKPSCKAPGCGGRAGASHSAFPELGALPAVLARASAGPRPPPSVPPPRVPSAGSTPTSPAGGPRGCAVLLRAAVLLGAAPCLLGRGTPGEHPGPPRPLGTQLTSVRGGPPRPLTRAFVSGPKGFRDLQGPRPAGLERGLGFPARDGSRGLRSESPRSER